MFKYTIGQRITVKETGQQRNIHRATSHNVMLTDGSIMHVDEIKPYSNNEKWQPEALVMDMSIIQDATTDGAKCINKFLSEAMRVKK